MNGYKPGQQTMPEDRVDIPLQSIRAREYDAKGDMVQYKHTGLLGETSTIARVFGVISFSHSVMDG